MTERLYCGDNVRVMQDLLENGEIVDCVYADMIYEDPNFSWVSLCYKLLRNGGVFYVQLDQKLVAEMKIFLDFIFGKKNMINWIVTLEDWGGRSRRCFGKKHDDILMYYKGNVDYKFYGDRIKIPKKTAGTAFDKNGGMKIPCDNFYDLGNFSTMSKERVKLNGKNIQWQKSLKLVQRLLLPITDEGDVILDPYLGSGTTAVWAKKNNRAVIGIENNPEVFSLAEKRIAEI